MAEKLTSYFRGGEYVFLYGEMGVGKTTFVKYLVNKFQIDQKLELTEVTSPTFNLLNEYKTNKFTIKHYDLFRIKNSLEIKDLDIFESEFRPMKHTLTGKEERTFMKIIVQRSSDLVLGVHMVGPDAGELIQGMAVALIAGATKSKFDATVGIHPTAAEEFVTMRSISRTA